ncbi:hypothetical protein L1987_23694 [Smallanthus sonchifolius]|uniref:Uncharacterized protein n=1 Tax=Smallanthus sonchifolius TaxID=185202 RepID=A0ACB9IJV7_9ASTR|nr:hypothetical protein L1987_23694 [Smallanthus sonchifolius]
MSFMKARKCLRKDHATILALVAKQLSEEKEIDDIPIVCDYPEVFLKDVPRLPTHCQVEFQIDQAPGAAPIARALTDWHLVNCKSYLLSYRICWIKVSSDPTHRHGELQSYLSRRRTELFSNCMPNSLSANSGLAKIQLLGHVVNEKGIHVDPSKVETIKDQTASMTAPETPNLNEFEYYNLLFTPDYLTKIRSAQLEALKEENLPLEATRVPDLLESQSGIPKAFWSTPTTRNPDVGMDQTSMDFIAKLPRTPSERDTIWVIVNRLTKSAHFLAIKETDKMEKITRIYLKEVVSRHGVPISIISDRDTRFPLRFWQSLQKALGTRLDLSTVYHPQTDGKTKRTIQTLEDMLRACVIDFGNNWKTHYNSYHTSIKATPFEALYGRRCRSPICWAEVGDTQLTGPELVFDTSRKIIQIRNRMAAARNRQKNYVDKRRKPLESQEGLSGVHDVFHVSNLKKCLANETLAVPLEELHIDEQLGFVEEPVEIMDREVKTLKRSEIPIVRVR